MLIKFMRKKIWKYERLLPYIWHAISPSPVEMACKWPGPSETRGHNPRVKAATCWKLILQQLTKLAKYKPHILEKMRLQICTRNCGIVSSHLPEMGIDIPIVVPPPKRIFNIFYAMCCQVTIQLIFKFIFMRVWGVRLWALVLEQRVITIMRCWRLGA